MAVNGYVLPTNGQMLPNSSYSMVNNNTTPELGQAVGASRGAVLTPQSTIPNSNVEMTRPNVDSIYNQYISNFSQTNPATANMLQTAYNDYGAFTESANNLNNLYNNIYTQTDPYYQNFANINRSLDQDIVGRLNNQLQTAYSQYGPEGEQTKRVQDYYANMANTIAAQNAANVGSIAASAAASGANTGAQRNAISQAQINANQEYLKLKQAEIQNYDSIYQNLNQYIDNFVKTYANSKDKYVRDTYNQLLQYKAGIEQARANSLISLEGSRLQKQLQDEAMAKARATASAGADVIPEVGIDALGRAYYIDRNGRPQFLSPEQTEIYNQRQLQTTNVTPVDNNVIR